MAKVIVKKYANRRLYDTERSSYITLDDLSEMIREGRDVEVVDAKSGEDITHQVLTQIIVEEEADGGGMLPVSFLRELISMYGGAMQGAVPNYLEAAMDAFKKQQAAMGGAFDPTVLTDMAKRNMEMFQSAATAFTGGSGAAKSASAKDNDHKEVDELRAELAALKAKVDKL
ncbi:polyhydroxyalkanoate synthesis repressor PhaR [Sphingomicrobium sediminis]|uniref:Polyhydroxyalkanoate synthesis repressor PhaR n=1 Tax=Sphingomicrobium sediminis TaxID=2950949 RepID=A0A9X2EFU5_9SPHN|nr:polyhydroxyalkanoate synthesis repressor PhaR [Sphingomicrobium sediminis]MCM8557220.1 polyhydroxyalkanoate synthesis repressor PhaR [Sphingomicrobium sediminis]